MNAQALITASTLWAKLARDPDGRITSWHSLLDHSADVAAVMLALLEQPVIAARLARLAERRVLDEVTCNRLAALAFLHDMGKANRGFRARIDPKAPLVGHIDPVAWLFHSDFGIPYFEEVERVLRAECWHTWFAAEPAYQLFDAVFAHHGRPWKRDGSADSAIHWRAEADGDPVADLSVLGAVLETWFPSAFQPGLPLPEQPSFHHAFAGLLMFADWLGSDTDFFPFDNGERHDPWRDSVSRARNAIRVTGLHAEAARTFIKGRRLDFSQSFGGRPPRPMQAVVAVPTACCIVLEAETGSGKTEAALWRFKALFEQGQVDGLYFALPTRVAATAMFARVRKFRDSIFGSSSVASVVVLAVPGQAAADGAEGHALPEFGFEWDDEPNEDVRLARWAAEHPKRFLAAPIAVGTIDQALLGAIRVKHAHMRGAVLLRHLLVVDEVHASDRYMETLLAALLQNHVGAGGHALLLSATLGAASRARLLGTVCPDPSDAEDVPYPALTWAQDRQEHRCIPETQASQLRKTVLVETVPLLDAPEAISRIALDAASAGAKVLIIRNTVGAAIATAQALEALVERDDPLLFRVKQAATVHHGRFAAADRRLLDAAVEDALGVNRIVGGRIVVGTQTLEVSLDLDADLLLTDLCPVDVLLQRIGRLHRHSYAQRPARFDSPRAIVLVPKSRSLLPFAGRAGGRHGLGRVYEDLRCIEATWRLIEADPVWSIPEMNRRLVERATHPSHLHQIAKELVTLNPAWLRHLQSHEGGVVAQLQSASSARLDWRKPFAEFWLDADETVATRLGAQDRIINLPPELRGPFDLPVFMLRIPRFLLDGVPAEAEPENAGLRSAGVVGFRLGSRQFSYDRFGLNADRGD